MNDWSVLTHIERLVDEEQQLRTLEEHDRIDVPALAADRDRLRQVEVELDRCWDLLRHRRARPSPGEKPDGARVRDAATVERYRQ